MIRKQDLQQKFIHQFFDLLPLTEVYLNKLYDETEQIVSFYHRYRKPLKGTYLVDSDVENR